MKKVVTYGNCQVRNVVRILATHPSLNKEYDFENALNIGNFLVIKTGSDLPYQDIETADLFIYQPTADKHGIYATSAILKHIKPSCKTISFPYIYNYAFWEVLTFADGDYAVGHSGMRYAHLNHKPITRLKDQGISFETIRQMIESKRFDWDFETRYKDTQTILREKEAECDVKVADFIDLHHRDTLLFYTQNHVTRFLLKHVADQMVLILGENPSLFPENIPHPDYSSGGESPEIPIGWFAWNHYKFKFIREPDMRNIQFIVHCAEKIYKGEGVNK